MLRRSIVQIVLGAAICMGMSTGSAATDWDLLLVEHPVDLSLVEEVEIGGITWRKVETTYFVVYYTDRSPEGMIRDIVAHIDNLWVFLKGRAGVERRYPIFAYLTPDRETHTANVRRFYPNFGEESYSNAVVHYNSNTVFVNVEWRHYASSMGGLMHEVTHLFSQARHEASRTRGQSWWSGEYMCQYFQRGTEGLFGGTKDSRQYFHGLFSEIDLPGWRDLDDRQMDPEVDFQFNFEIVRSVLFFLEEVYGGARCAQFWRAVVDAGSEGGLLRDADMERILWDIYGKLLDVLEAEWRQYYADPEDRLIREMVDGVSEPEAEAVVRRLVGFRTRLADTDSARAAAMYLFERFRSYGIESVAYHDFDDRFAPNVVAEIPGVVWPERIYVLCGHYDSMSDVREDAPGANDNASGVAAVMEAARVMGQHGFACMIRFAAFSAEEYGLRGSRAYVEQAVERGENIVGAINVDMVGYVASGDPIALRVSRLGDPQQANVPEDLAEAVQASSKALSDVFFEVAPQYVPDLELRDRPTTGGSDEVAFWRHGIGAVHLIGASLYSGPARIHTPDDKIGTLFNSFRLVQRTAEAAVAALGHLAVPMQSGARPVHDLIVEIPLLPGKRIHAFSPIRPTVVIWNLGTAEERDIPVVLHIRSDTDEIYSEIQTAGIVEASGSLEVLFPDWTPWEAGRYHFDVEVEAPQDENPGNNVLSKAVDVVHPFTDVSPTAGIEDVPGNAVALGDYDADGYMDVYMVIPGGANVLYRNNRDGTFSDVTSTAGVGDQGTGQDAAFFDYDNDGHLDLYVVNGGAPSKFDLPGRTNVLYHSNGNGSFTEVSSTAGVDHKGSDRGVAVGDYDQDGYVDLYVVVSQAPNILYRNNGDGTFQEMTASAGVGDVGDGRDAVFFDCDGDRDADLYVVNDGRNALYRNNGDGTFDPADGIHPGVLADVAGEGKGWNAAVGDYDNDGDLDLYMGNVPSIQSALTDFSLQPSSGQDRNGLYRNNGEGTFTEVSLNAGVGVIERKYSNVLGQGAVFGKVYRRGVVFGDYDNDGDLDVYVAVVARTYGYELPGILYRNRGDGTFSDVTAFDANGQASVLFDYDGDGDLDVLIRDRSGPEKLYRNDGEGKEWMHWLEVKGIGTQSNRDGIGARVRVVTGDLAQLREIRSESGLVAHFGLGERTWIDTLEIIWPSGRVDVMTDLEADQRITIREGSGVVTSVEGGRAQRIPQSFSLSQNVPNPFNASTTIRYALSEASSVEVAIFDVLGRKVRTLVSGGQSAGAHRVVWDGRGEDGRAVGSGVYVCSVGAGDFSAARRMVLLR